MLTHTLGRLFNKHVSVTTGSSLYVLQRFYNLGREETHTHVATHLRASHPHCSHYDPSSSPTDLLIIAAPKPPPPTHIHTHALISYTISHRPPLLIVSTSFMFHTVLHNELTAHTQRQRKRTSITPFRHLQSLHHVILCHWLCGIPDKWNLINHHRKLQKAPYWESSIFHL